MGIDGMVCRIVDMDDKFQYAMRREHSAAPCCHVRRAPMALG